MNLFVVDIGNVVDDWHSHVLSLIKEKSDCVCAGESDRGNTISDYMVLVADPSSQDY